VISFSRREVDWAKLFGNRQPVEIEIGSGKGAFLLAYAEKRPELNLLGIENQPRWVSWIERRLARTPRDNVRILCADAALIVSAFIRDDTVAAYHLYFPDPWWKRRHYKRRLVRTDFARHLLRTLEPGGAVHLATDVGDRFVAMRDEFSRLPFATRVEAEPTPRGRPLTNFERKYRAEGRRLHYATFTKSAR
jgi:tRNA (guanine-N7-)-methyltransferase